MRQVAAYEGAAQLRLDAVGVAVEERLERGVLVGGSSLRRRRVLPHKLGFVALRLQRLELLQTAAVASAFELAGEESVDNVAGDAFADAPGAEAEDVGVRVLSGARAAKVSWQRAARMPLTLLAQTVMPTPLLQIRMPRSSSPRRRRGRAGLRRR